MSQEQIIESHKTLNRSVTDGAMRLTYSETSVVGFDNKEIRLNTGGWWTVNTKIHLNQVSRQFKLGYRVFVKKETWYLEYQGQIHLFVEPKIRLDRVTGEVTPDY